MRRLNWGTIREASFGGEEAGKPSQTPGGENIERFECRQLKRTSRLQWDVQGKKGIDLTKRVNPFRAAEEKAGFKKKDGLRLYKGGGEIWPTKKHKPVVKNTSRPFTSQ